MSDAADLGPIPRRIPVGADLVSRLVAEQFPQWADLPVRPVADGGWDNWTFHLGARMSVRLPSAAEYALAVDKEHRWLPILAPRLPVPIPTPLAKGSSRAGYPFSWSVYSWLDGSPATGDQINDPVRFAVDLAEFLAALQDADPAGGPTPGLHNWHRGGPLHTYDGEFRRGLAALNDNLDPAPEPGRAAALDTGRTTGLDAGRAAALWQEALDARWDGTPVWFHGDIAQGNLLLDDGQLSAVIDFGTCGVGDPACDLAIAWTLLTAEGRRAFRDRLSIDDATWARGRGWALWKMLVTYADTAATSQVAQRALGEILADPVTRS